VRVPLLMQAGEIPQREKGFVKVSICAVASEQKNQIIRQRSGLRPRGSHTEGKKAQFERGA